MTRSSDLHPRCPRCGSDNVSRHLTPTVPECEADQWAPVREEGYLCRDCDLTEGEMDNADDFLAFRERWSDPVRHMSLEEMHEADERGRLLDEARDREWTWPEEFDVTDRESRVKTLASHSEDRTHIVYSNVNDELVLSEADDLPTNRDLFSRIVTYPDDHAPRWEYARWLRQQDHLLARDAADFVEGQLQLAESLRKDPRADIKGQLPANVFARRDVSPQDIPGQLWWRYPRSNVGDALCDFTAVLLQQGLIDEPKFYGGFVEHVAIKAARFLELADELYSLAPIRQLTLTYCKGIDHQDDGLLRALLASPHLDRIRALRLPVRYVGKQYAELNRFTDSDIELLAASPHLRGLAYLDLEDEEHLTIRAFDALAARANLPALSLVRHELYRYGFRFGGMGPHTRQLAALPLESYAADLEARHGRIAWLHAAETYGSSDPDIEAVVEHPVALLATRQPRS
ncbi:MAG: hypothetical protein WKG01_14225 [Kofleriaceae bacterium]